MPFSVPDSTLEALEWDRVVATLRGYCRTPQATARLDAREASLFEEDDERVLVRLQETDEARALAEQDFVTPLGMVRELDGLLARAEKGDVLEASELLDVGHTARALAETRRDFETRTGTAPALATLAAALRVDPELDRAISAWLDDAGEVRDAASPELARARREVARLGHDLGRRIARILADSELEPHLSDRYYTERAGRFVLPVRADARGRVRGIVHDASRTGTTLFVEPESMVEPNNRHREAQLTVERETLRVLRELSARVAAEADDLRAALEGAAALDLALARGAWSMALGANPPTVGRDGVFDLPALRHPLIPADECVANDLRVGEGYRVLLLSGANAGGKTVAMKSLALAALFVRAGLHVPSAPGARVDLVDRVLADIGDHQDLQQSLSTFSAKIAALARILEAAGPHTLVCLDEVGVGTDPSEGAALAQATLEALADADACVVTTTHYNLLKEMAALDPRFENASVEFDPETLAPTYRVVTGVPGASSARSVAARMGLARPVLDRADALLDHSDRQLDRMLAELAESRARLERERGEVREASEAAERLRQEYDERLARLHARRDALYEELRAGLDRSFREAHGEVARLVRELQRAPSSRKAGATREALKTLRTETEEAQRETGLVPPPEPATPPAPSVPTEPIAWDRVAVGQAVRTVTGATGVLCSLPDARGRVRVQVGGATVVLSKDRLVGDARPEHERRPKPATLTASEFVAPAARGGVLETDLRGMRVDEALDQLDADLDRAALEGRDELRIIHGIGTGALKRAVLERLPDSPHVAEIVAAPRDQGGGGATLARLQSE